MKRLLFVLLCLFALKLNSVIDKKEEELVLKNVPQTEVSLTDSDLTINTLSNIDSNISKLIPKKLLGMQIEILISFTLSLMVAFSAVILTHYISTVKRRKNLIRTYRFMIKNLVIASNAQSDNFKKIIDILDEKKTHNNYPLDINCNFNLNSINKLPLDLIIEKLIRNKSKSELFDFFLKQLNIINEISNSYKDIHILMVSKFNQYLKDWNYNINKIREFYDSYRTYLEEQGHLQRGFDQFFDSYDSIYGSYSRNPDYLDYYVAIDELIKPLKTLCLENTDNRIVLPLLNNLLGCESAFENYELSKGVYSKVFTGFVNKINEATDYLTNNVESIFSKIISPNIRTSG